ncbi:MAG: hypothetical protein ACK5KO_13740 [Arachnia sp.]
MFHAPLVAGQDAIPEQLVAAVRAVSNGDAVVTPRITRRMLDAAHWTPRESAAVSDDFAVLTEALTLSPLRGDAFGRGFSCATDPVGARIAV